VGLKVVMDSINAVIGTSSITLDDITYQLEFILGGDLKVIKPVETCSNTHIILLLQNLQFLLLMMGLNEAHSNYACVWCHVHKDPSKENALVVVIILNQHIDYELIPKLGCISCTRRTCSCNTTLKRYQECANQAKCFILTFSLSLQLY